MTWIDRHPRLCFFIGAACALVVGVSVGRFSAPLQVQTIDVVKVQFRDREVVKEVVREVKAKAETRIVYRDRVITKDGTVTEREVERTDTKTDATRSSEGVKVSDRASTSESSRTQTVTLRPKWRVGVGVGASWNAPLVPIAGPLVLQVEADYRIVGGLSVGARLNTAGVGVVAVTMEF